MIKYQIPHPLSRKYVKIAVEKVIKCLYMKNGIGA